MVLSPMLHFALTPLREQSEVLTCD